MKETKKAKLNRGNLIVKRIGWGFQNKATGLFWGGWAVSGSRCNQGLQRAKTVKHRQSARDIKLSHERVVQLGQIEGTHTILIIK